MVEVDRALAAARRAVGRLVALPGSEDPRVIPGAARSLVEIGPLAVAPPGSALPRAAATHHRLAIVGVLEAIGPRYGAPVVRPLLAAYRRDGDPIVRSRAMAALAHVMGERVNAMVRDGADPHPAGAP